MSIRIEVYKEPRGEPRNGERTKEGVLTEAEECRFFFFARRLRLMCEEMKLAKYISFIRISPASAAGSASIQRSVFSTGATANIGAEVMMGIRFGNEKQRKAKEFETRYWGRPMNSPHPEVPFEDSSIERCAKFIFNEIVKDALTHHRETIGPVVQLEKILESANAE